jgi:hypothetical protein
MTKEKEEELLRWLGDCARQAESDADYHFRIEKDFDGARLLDIKSKTLNQVADVIRRKFVS